MSDTPEIDAAELYYDGPTGYVPIEDARKVERKFNKLREALERISDLRKTDDVNWESMSFTAKVIADFALAQLEEKSQQGPIENIIDGLEATSADLSVDELAAELKEDGIDVDGLKAKVSRLIEDHREQGSKEEESK